MYPRMYVTGEFSCGEFIRLDYQSKMANPRKLKRGLPTNVALEPSKQNEFNQKIKNITKKV